MTLADPATALTQESLFDIACKNAEGLIDPGQITAGIWSYFTDRDVRRVDGQQLSYYGNWGTVVNTTEGLLSSGDGICDSWAKFFIDLMRVHGIQGAQLARISPVNGGGILIKKWIFPPAGAGGTPTHPFLNIWGPTEELGNSYNWLYSQVRDDIGIPGQGTNNPESWFYGHMQVKIGTKYYDPSYGTPPYDSIAHFEALAVEAFTEDQPQYLVDEPVVDFDLNGNTLRTDMRIPTTALVIQPHSDTNTIPDMIEVIESY